nr:DUF4262 domain-containing protein [Williamsia herbipolensis]
MAQGGWHVVAVMAGTERDEPPFAYTTGLTSPGRPELMVYGLPQRISGLVVNSVAERIVTGENITHGSALAAVLAEHDVVVIDADDTTDMFQTRSLYAAFSAMQVVFPTGATDSRGSRGTPSTRSCSHSRAHRRDERPQGSSSGRVPTARGGGSCGR